MSELRDIVEKRLREVDQPEYVFGRINPKHMRSPEPAHLWFQDDLLFGSNDPKEGLTKYPRPDHTRDEPHAPWKWDDKSIGGGVRNPTTGHTMEVSAYKNSPRGYYDDEMPQALGADPSTGGYVIQQFTPDGGRHAYAFAPWHGLPGVRETGSPHDEDITGHYLIHMTHPDVQKQIDTTRRRLANRMLGLPDD